MDIDSLTLGDARKLLALVGAVVNGVPPHPFTGRYCIFRCAYAGVHAGVLVSQDGESAIVSGSRRLWSWKQIKGVALSGVAMYGLDPGCKIDTALNEIALTGVIETIPCTDEARRSIETAK